MAQAAPLADPEAHLDERRFGRASISLNAKLYTSSGRSQCEVTDLSIQGARIETDKAVKDGETLWLEFGKLRIFASVQWTQAQFVGLLFEELLPKAFLMHLTGNRVDPLELEAAETRLAAQKWVVGDPAVRSKDERLFNVLGSESYGPKPGETVGLIEPSASVPARTGLQPKGSGKRSAIVVVLSALLGAALGSFSSLIF